MDTSKHEARGKGARTRVGGLDINTTEIIRGDGSPPPPLAFGLSRAGPLARRRCRRPSPHEPTDAPGLRETLGDADAESDADTLDVELVLAAGVLDALTDCVSEPEKLGLSVALGDAVVLSDGSAERVVDALGDTSDDVVKRAERVAVAVAVAVSDPRGDADEKAEMVCVVVTFGEIDPTGDAESEMDAVDVLDGLDVAERDGVLVAVLDDDDESDGDEDDDSDGVSAGDAVPGTTEMVCETVLDDEGAALRVSRVPVASGDSV